MKILITGATGFVGKIIVKRLLAQGHSVVVLTRDVKKAANVFGQTPEYLTWDGRSPLPVLPAVEGVINLMGEGIAEKRWSAEQKTKIYQSRIEGTSYLVRALSSMTVKPKVLVSASAIGIYGTDREKSFDESSPLGEDFLAHVCKDWEKEALKAESSGIRVVCLRTGIVLGRTGGALPKMLPPFKLGLGGPLGDGQQYMSWIHVEDLVSLYVEALNNDSFQGPFNGTAPSPVSNREFTKTLGTALGRPTFFAVPAVALKLALGEMSTILLDGQKVLPRKALECKFTFRYQNLLDALKEIVG